MVVDFYVPWNYVVLTLPSEQKRISSMPKRRVVCTSLELYLEGLICIPYERGGVG